MKLSTKGQYALHAMVFLAEKADEGPQSLTRISRAGLPKEYLEQLLGVLRRKGLVTAVRGAQGGYQLARPPEGITVAEVLNSVEGPVSLCKCTQKEDFCDKSDECKIRQTWIGLTRDINGLMSGITLKDILHQTIPSSKGERL